MNKYIDICNPPKKKLEILSIIGALTYFKELLEDKEIACYAASIAVTMKDVSPTQMRRYYSYVKGIEQINRHLVDNETRAFKDKHKLILLLPKIAGSSERKHLHDLYEIVAVCIPKIMDVGDVRAFVAFFEAILDYHSTIERKPEDQ
jgi:CRISPR-associated protein Csm2